MARYCWHLYCCTFMHGMLTSKQQEGQAPRPPALTSTSIPPTLVWQHAVQSMRWLELEIVKNNSRAVEISSTREMVQACKVNMMAESALQAWLQARALPHIFGALGVLVLSVPCNRSWPWPAGGGGGVPAPSANE